MGSLVEKVSDPKQVSPIVVEESVEPAPGSLYETAMKLQGEGESEP